MRAPESLSVTSPAFEDGSTIPVVYTCDGAETSPPLEWKGGPDATEYAVTAIDPDAPGGDFAHWAVWKIPSSAAGVGEGELPEGAIEGTNDFGETGYSGPCPPEGDDAHNYVFTVYALESGVTGELEPADGAGDLLEAISCCTTAKGTLTGTYRRP